MVEDSPVDHLHHHGVWWGHGDINGVDCYLELAGGEGSQHKGAVRHCGFSGIVDEPEGEPPRFGFDEDIAWDDHLGERLLDERRSLLFTLAGPDHYTVDLSSAYTAARDLTFGDTKESVLPGVRIAEALTGMVGGTITSSTGAVGEVSTMGAPAEWIDVSGPRRIAYLGGDIVEGIACFDHPENPGHPQRFFTREYGPISPFPGHHFYEVRTLGAGEALRLRHRLVVHRGDCATAEIAARYDEFRLEATR
jgi:hypothetical protein